MCWQVVTHTLKCDVRPIIYDGMYAKYIDPFRKPVDCKCADEHNARIQCPHHGCCYLQFATMPCSHPNCQQTYDIHRYKRPSRQQQIWGIKPTFYTQPDNDWESIDYVDFAIFSTDNTPQVIDWAPDFTQLMENLLGMGRQLASKHQYLANVLTEIEDHRQLHSTQHGVLCNSKTLTCPVIQEIKNAEQVAMNLRSEGQAMSIEFKRLWDDVNNRVTRHMVQEQVEAILRLRGIK